MKIRVYLTIKQKIHFTSPINLLLTCPSEFTLFVALSQIFLMHSCNNNYYLVAEIVSSSHCTVSPFCPRKDHILLISISIVHSSVSDIWFWLFKSRSSRANKIKEDSQTQFHLYSFFSIFCISVCMYLFFSSSVVWVELYRGVV